ncbi:MAG: STAS domain-containing protein [Pseudomonadota bacterium]
MLESNKVGDMVMVKIGTSCLDAAFAGDFQSQMTEIVETGERHFVLDMSDVEHIDSDGLSAIVGLQKLVGRAGTVELTGVSGSVMKVFKLTRVHQTLLINQAA